MKRLEPQQMLGLRVMGKKGLDAYQRYEKELKHPNELQDNPFWEHFICIKGEIKESPQGLTNLNIVLR